MTYRASSFSGNTPVTSSQVVGTTTNDNAAAGIVGEYITATATNVSVVTATATTITSISLTPGDWDVTGLIQLNPSGSTTTQATLAGISTTNNTFGTITAGFNNLTWLPFSVAAGSGSVTISAPITRISIAATTTVYLISEVFFSVSTMTVSGFIRARRVR